METTIATKVLQSAFDADPAALHALMCNRVPCNEKLAHHPQVPVDMSALVPGTYTVSAIGLVNAVLVALGLPLVAMKIDKSSGEPRLVGFCDYVLPGEQAEGMKIKDE